jgi:hypothetical protein
MAVFTFYICKQDGSAASFEAFELESDTDAPDRANAMLAEHLSCAFVSVWQGERKVLTQQRRPPRADVDRVEIGVAHQG